MLQQPDALGGVAVGDRRGARLHLGDGLGIRDGAGRGQPLDRRRAGGGEEGGLEIGARSWQTTSLLREFGARAPIIQIDLIMRCVEPIGEAGHGPSADDPSCRRYPRLKFMDDASAILVRMES
jgi:hypothetical protein